MSASVPMETEATGRGENAGKNNLWLTAAAYIGLFLLAYFVFLIATFPYDILAKGIAGSLQNNIPKELQPLQFDEFHPSFPLGAVVKGLEAGRSTGGGPLLEAKKVEFSAAALKALRGKWSAQLKAELYGGKLNASFDGDASGGKAALNFAGIKLELLNQLKDASKLELSGKAHGNLELQFSPQWQQNSAQLSIDIDSAAAHNVDLKILKTEFNFTKAQGEFSLKKGVLTIEQCVLEGQPTGMELTGTIKINEGFLSASYMDIWITFSPTPEFESSIPFALFQSAGQGKYKGHLRGTFKNAQFP